MIDFGATLQELLQAFLLFLPHLIAALIIFILTLLLAGAVGRWVLRSGRRTIQDPETLYLLSRLARWAVLIVGTLVALDQVDFDLTSFVAGLGIVGLTVGFALQDIARNFVSGILLLVRQPFNIGDAVKVSDYSGKVTEINTRDTVIKTWDGELVIIPNIDVFTQPIINYTQHKMRRRVVRAGIGYEEDIGEVVNMLTHAVTSVEGVQEDPAPSIVVEELGDSAVQLSIYFWINQETHGLFDVHSAVVSAIKNLADVEGIDMPYPTQIVRLEGPGLETLLSRE
jgi:small-conductance mechanosensitive channel